MKSIIKFIICLAFLPIGLAYGQSDDSQPPGDVYVPSDNAIETIISGPNTQPPGEIYVPSPNRQETITDGPNEQVIPVELEENSALTNEQLASPVQAITTIRKSEAVGTPNPKTSNENQKPLDQQFIQQGTTEGNANGQPSVNPDRVPLDQMYKQSGSTQKVNQNNPNRKE